MLDGVLVGNSSPHIVFPSSSSFSWFSPTSPFYYFKIIIAQVLSLSSFSVSSSFLSDFSSFSTSFNNAFFCSFDPFSFSFDVSSSSFSHPLPPRQSFQTCFLFIIQPQTLFVTNNDRDLPLPLRLGYVLYQKRAVRLAT